MRSEAGQGALPSILVLPAASSVWQRWQEHGRDCYLSQAGLVARVIAGRLDWIQHGRWCHRWTVLARLNSPPRCWLWMLDEAGEIVGGSLLAEVGRQCFGRSADPPLLRVAAG